MEWVGDLERAFAASIYPNRVAIAIATAIVAVVLAIVARRRGWFGGVRRHPARAALIGVLALAILGPVGWYLASPLFISTSINEPPPVAAVEPTLSPTPGAPSTSASMPDATPDPTPAPTPTPTSTPRPLALAGPFSGADDFHFGRGTARLVETTPGAYVVRLEDFEVRNGPDLYVYLSPDRSGYVDTALELGRLKADKGNQNYDVPSGLDPASAGSVVIWCKQFSVLFAVAPLAPDD
jgi:electron transfer DM13